MAIAYAWSPIEPLSEDERQMYLGLQPLIEVWRDAQDPLERPGNSSLSAFKERLVRRWSIETGILERIYFVDRGLTKVLVEEGFVEDFVSREGTDMDPARLITILKDHESAYNLLMECVHEERELTVGFIHELHFALTRHQETVTGQDQFGRQVEIPLIKGAYKLQPNNPSREDGSTHEYCPPLQVAPEMERLVELLEEYRDDNPIVVAAWLHHRFTQIHPYQDGNGRVARALTALVLLRAELLPFVVDRNERDEYLKCLEGADRGDLSYLVQFFSDQEQEILLRALSIKTDSAEQSTGQVVEAVIANVGHQLRKRQQLRAADLTKVNALALRLRERARSIVGHAIHSLDEEINSASPAGTYIRSFTDVGGPEEGTAHYYKWEVVKSARTDQFAENVLEGNEGRDGKFINFARPHYFAKGSLRVDRERLVFITSFHHIGYEDFGVMEATAFAQMISLDTSDEQGSTRTDVVVCSSEPFAYAFSTEFDNVVDVFEEWLMHALAKAIASFGERI